MWEKIKNYLKKFKIWLIAILGIGVALAAGMNPDLDRMNRINAISDKVNIDGKIINILYTDDNSNENLIIKSDHKDYYGTGTFESLFLVSNVSSENQDVKLAFTYPDGWNVLEIKRFVRTDILAATSSDYIPQKTIWENGTLATFSENKERKFVEGITPLETGSYFIKSGETAFFSVVFFYPKGKYIDEKTRLVGEWYIEAFGNDYGHLDPLLYEHSDIHTDTAAFYGVYWNAQSFSATANYSLEYTILYLDGVYTPTEDVILGVRTSLTGSDLTSVTINGSTIGTNYPTGVSITLTYSSALSLTSGTTYYLVIRSPNTVEGDRIYWIGDADNTFAGGQAYGSADSGASWGAAPVLDYYFQNYGTATAPPPSIENDLIIFK